MFAAHMAARHSLRVTIRVVCIVSTSSFIFLTTCTVGTHFSPCCTATDSMYRSTRRAARKSPPRRAANKSDAANRSKEFCVVFIALCSLADPKRSAHSGKPVWNRHAPVLGRCVLDGDYLVLLTPFRHLRGELPLGHILIEWPHHQRLE